MPGRRNRDQKRILRWILGFLILISIVIQLWVGWIYSSLLSPRVLNSPKTNTRLESDKNGIPIKSGEGSAATHNLPKRRIDPRSMKQLQNAGLNLTSLDEKMLASIPDWATIESTLGSSKPLILGLETCETFRSIINNKPRYIGVSGLFNSGTNVLAYLLDKNCKFEHGKGEPLWQVPWGKHSRARRRQVQTVPGYEHYNKTRVLPAVVVRNPFEVLESMCRNAYSVQYPERANSTCPHMVDHNSGELLAVEVGKTKPGTAYPSIIHFWNRWYQEYLTEFPHPRLMIRLEDLTVHPKETVASICECAGGKMVNDFSYMLTSAKKGMGHGKDSEKNGLIEAWARLGREVPFPLDDYEAAQKYVDGELMASFRYKAPPRKEA